MLRLAMAGLIAALAAFDMAAAAETTLLPGAPLTGEIVAGLVRSDLAERGIEGELVIEVREPPAPVSNEARGAMRLTLADLSYDLRTGRYRARLDAALPSGETATIPTSGRIEQLVEVAVPARPIARGETILAQDVASARLFAALLPGDGLRRAEDLVGRQATRSLAPGRVARAGDVAAPWQVRRGEDTSIAFARGGLQIMAAAVALENGRQGETIRVRNAASGEVRRAIVVGARRVEVTNGLP